MKTLRDAKMSNPQGLHSFEECQVCQMIGSGSEGCTHGNPSPFSIVENRQILERELIRRAVKRKGGNMTQAAATLEISLKTMYAKIHEYNLEEEVELNRCRTSRA